MLVCVELWTIFPYSMALDKKISTAVYKRDNWCCRHCNNRNSLTPHHIIFQSQQGTDNLNNLLTLCICCHNAVHKGRLKIIVLDKTDTDVVVSFKRLKGFIPT